MYTHTHTHTHTTQESLEHPLAQARVSLSHPQLHLYAATLSITAQLNWLQHVMHHWCVALPCVGWKEQKKDRKKEEGWVLA
jgi:hypothetical protein